MDSFEQSMNEPHVDVRYDLLIHDGRGHTRKVGGTMTINIAHVSSEFDGDPTAECIYRLSNAYAMNDEHLILNECYAWREGDEYLPKDRQHV